MSASIFAPVFAVVGDRLGPRRLYIFGSFLQAVAGGIAFAFLDLIDDVTPFLALSYFLRFIYGVSDAASFGAVLAIMV